MNTECCSEEKHRAMKADLRTWESLQLIGVQTAEAFEDEPAFTIELRNCACGSTLALER